MRRGTIAIVEDEALLALDLQDLCQAAGHHVLGTAATATQARQKFLTSIPDILITDMNLADGSEGVEVAEAMRRQRPDVVVIFITAATAADTLQRISAVRPDRILKKPLRTSELHEALAASAQLAGSVEVDGKQHERERL